MLLRAILLCEGVLSSQPLRLQRMQVLESEPKGALAASLDRCAAAAGRCRRFRAQSCVLPDSGDATQAQQSD